MAVTSSVRALPARPSLEYLRKLAKERLRVLREADASKKLADAQLAVAREHGFTSWRALHAHVSSAKPVNVSHVIRDVMKAIVRGDTAALKTLIETYPPIVHVTGPHPQWGGRPQPLHVSIEMNQRAAFDLLLEAGADPTGDSSQYDGWSPLMLSVHWQREAMRDALLKRGAHVGLIEALMLADDRRVAAMLKNDAAVLEAAMPNDATPLHFARTARAVNLLLDAGVSLEHGDKYGRTALHAAAKRGSNAKVIALLLQHGGNPALPTRDGQTAIDLAKAHNRTRVVDQLKAAAT